MAARRLAMAVLAASFSVMGLPAQAGAGAELPLDLDPAADAPIGPASTLEGPLELWGLGLWPATNDAGAAVVVNGAWTVTGGRISGSWSHTWVDRTTGQARATCTTAGSGRITGRSTLSATLTLAPTTCEGTPPADAQAWADAVRTELDKFWLEPADARIGDWQLGDGTPIGHYVAALSGQIGLDVTHVAQVQAPSFFHADDAIAPRSFFGLAYRPPADAVSLVDHLEMRPAQATAPTRTAAP